jgi:hypothetical protein
MTFYLHGQTFFPSAVCNTKIGFFLFQEHTALIAHACRMKVMRLDLNCMVLSRTLPASITLPIISHKKYKLSWSISSEVWSGSFVKFFLLLSTRSS